MKTRFTALLFLTLAAGASADAQCVLDPIRVDRIEGRLIFGFQNQYRMLDRGEITLTTLKDTQTIAASASVGQEGAFEIAGVRPGKYVLSARSEALIPASVVVEVVRVKVTPGRRLILIVLAADATKECGGASIKVQSRAEVDRILATANRPRR